MTVLRADDGGNAPTRGMTARGKGGGGRNPPKAL